MAKLQTSITTEKRELTGEERRRLLVDQFEVLSFIETSDSSVSAYIRCPGESHHTTRNGHRDCRVTLDDKPPTIHCLHSSCRCEVDTANHRLRSAEGRLSVGLPPDRPVKTGNSPKLVAETPKVTLIPQSIPTSHLSDALQRDLFLTTLFTHSEWFGIVFAEEDGSIRSKGRTYQNPPDVYQADPPQITPHPMGTWVRVNPLKEGGSADADVIAYRHVLIESDTAPVETQWAAIVAANLPCTAVVHSGGKSLHAFVRVDAKNLEEYKARANKVADAVERFDGMKVDRACLNPSRLARLPGCPRGEKRQELVCGLRGPLSYAKWEEYLEGLKFGERFRLSDLQSFRPMEDPQSVIGNRWLCRGGSLLLLGQSGVGKSCLNLQLAGAWATGDPTLCGLLAFNMIPKRPLKIVLVQAENDLGDMAEVWQGVFSRMRGMPSETRKMLEENLTIFRNTDCIGDSFLNMYMELCHDLKPDMVIVDPLLSYIGNDINDQEVCSMFCHNLTQVQKETGVISVLVHHFGKPKSASQNNVLTETDLAYQGLGSSVLTNWAREVLSLNRIKERDGDPPTFRLTATKRRKKAGMLSLEQGQSGQPSPHIFIQHSANPTVTGTIWQQCLEPVFEDEEQPRRRK